MPGLGSPGWVFLSWDIGFFRERFAADLPGICNRSPDALEGSSVCEILYKTAASGTWSSDLHLVTFQSVNNDGDSSFFHP